MKKTIMLLLSLLLVGGSFTVGMATHEGAPHLKIVQGILKGTDPAKKTVTVEIVEGQAVTLKVSDAAFEQLHRVGKKGKRVELRISDKDVVETVAVGTGP